MEGVSFRVMFRKEFCVNMGCIFLVVVIVIAGGGERGEYLIVIERLLFWVLCL